MAYCKWIEGLPKAAKIVLAIIPPTSVLFLVYRILADVFAKKWGLLVWDGVFGIILGIVFYIFDIISIIKKNEIFTFAEWFGEDGGIEIKEEEAKEEKKEEDVIEAEEVK